MRLLLIFISSLLFSACSMEQTLVRASIPMIDGGVEALNHETDLDLAEDSIPANLNMLQGMIKIDPENVQLHTYASQAFYGLAYGFNEDTRPGRASDFYVRGMKHGIQALELNGASNLLDSTLADFNEQVAKMGNKDVPAMFWASSNWAKWIDMNRDDPEAISQLARTTALMQRVIELDETFYFGGPHMYFGVYYGSRAPSIGGNYEKSKEHFDRARKATNGKLLIPDLLEAQFLARQMLDRDQFHRLLTGIVNSPDDLMPELALQNQIAKRKASLLLKKEEEWF